MEGKAKYALWEAVDQKLLQDLSREDKGPAIQKTFAGNQAAVWATVLTPKSKSE